MRKALERAIKEHLREQGELTGYLLITFQDGVATITSQASENDEAAQEVIEGIEAALMHPDSAADDGSDEIGICAGNA